MKTLLLDNLAWDLVLDAQGNVALASDPYSMAQDAASAGRTFLGEVYYDTTLGIPYFQQILGRQPSAQLIKAALVKAALTVPGVASAVCYLQRGPNRQVTGQVQVTTTAGQTLPAVGAFAPQPPPGPPWPPGQFDFTDARQSLWTAI